MNMLKALIITCFTVHSAFAGISEDVKSLGKLAMGSDEIQFTKSKDAHDLLKKFITKEHDEFEADRFVSKEIDQMSFGDEIDYGFTSTKSAIAMAGFAQGQLEEILEGIDDDTEALRIKGKIYDLNKNWASVIKRLERSGAKFGYDGHGPGYCGISFIRLLIVDTQSNKVHIVYLSESGPC